MKKFKPKCKVIDDGNSSSGLSSVTKYSNRIETETKMCFQNLSYSRPPDVGRINFLIFATFKQVHIFHFTFKVLLIFFTVFLSRKIFGKNSNYVIFFEISTIFYKLSYHFLSKFRNFKLFQNIKLLSNFRRTSKKFDFFC